MLILKKIGINKIMALNYKNNMNIINKKINVENNRRRCFLRFKQR